MFRVLYSFGNYIYGVSFWLSIWWFFCDVVFEGIRSRFPVFRAISDDVSDGGVSLTFAARGCRIFTDEERGASGKRVSGSWILETTTPSPSSSAEGAKKDLLFSWFSETFFSFYESGSKGVLIISTRHVYGLQSSMEDLTRLVGNWSTNGGLFSYVRRLVGRLLVGHYDVPARDGTYTNSIFFQLKQRYDRISLFVTKPNE